MKFKFPTLPSLPQTPWGKMICRILTNQENVIMPTLAEVVADMAEVKADLDLIKTGVTNLEAANKSLADQLAAAVAANDPAQLQAAVDAANALVTQAQGVVSMFPPAAPPA